MTLVGFQRSFTHEDLLSVYLVLGVVSVLFLAGKNYMWTKTIHYVSVCSSFSNKGG